jgi:tRNA(Ile)-lysidine synthase
VVALKSHVAGFFERHPPGQRLGIAYSGGLDSTVLLHLLAELADPFGYRLTAVHVHHGLSPDADAWVEHCRRQCLALDVPLQVERVQVQRDGLGLEAAARDARYRVFAGLAVDALALAHHRDDQAETVLLQLLRGGGMKGLAAMPAERPLAELRLLRPLLDVPRSDLAAYARARGLAWVDDASNGDLMLRRNAIRHQLLPLFADLYPGAVATLAQGAARFAEAAHLLDVLAEQDGATAPNGLDLAGLAQLEPARGRNVLRRYLELHGVSVHRERLHEAWAQMLRARGDADPAIDFGGATLRRFRGRALLAPSAPAARRSWAWQGETELDLGVAGHLDFTATRGAGVRLDGDVKIVLRQGGETLRPDSRRPARTLKNLLREAGVPTWWRERLPLVQVDGRLAWVAEIGADAGFQAGPEEAGWLISWRRPG